MHIIVARRLVVLYVRLLVSFVSSRQALATYPSASTTVAAADREKSSKKSSLQFRQLVGGGRTLSRSFEREDLQTHLTSLARDD